MKQAIVIALCSLPCAHRHASGDALGRPKRDGGRRHWHLHSRHASHVLDPLQPRLLQLPVVSTSALHAGFHSEQFSLPLTKSEILQVRAQQPDAAWRPPPASEEIRLALVSPPLANDCGLSTHQGSLHVAMSHDTCTGGPVSAMC